MSESASKATLVRVAVRELREIRRALLLDAQRMMHDSQYVALLAEVHPAVEEPADDERWQHVRDAVPEFLHAGVEDLRAASEELDDLLRDASTREAFMNWLDDRARVLRSVVLSRKANELGEAFAARAAELSNAASASGRQITTRELERQGALHHQAQEAFDSANELLSLHNSAEREAAIEALAAARVKVARQQLAAGLVLTKQMRDIIAESVPSLKQGEPMLLLGETGGAKTALARYLSNEFLGGSSEIVSGFADMTAGQLMGTYELRVTQGATESVFVDGPLTRAISQGKPIIVDEINALPPEFLKRLNLILQLRPGDEYQLQEHAGRVITVAEGFVILATANEHTPNRYRGLERLSAELTNRFGANSYRVKYPDSATAYDEFPQENTLLAYAAVVDEHGEMPRTITADSVERAARAAFISQQVFAGSHGEGFEQYRSAEQRIDGRSGLEETVLAPRTLVAILHKAASSGGAVSIERALERFLESIMHPEDRQVHQTILRSQGLTK